MRTTPIHNGAEMSYVPSGQKCCWTVRMIENTIRREPDRNKTSYAHEENGSECGLGNDFCSFSVVSDFFLGSGSLKEHHYDG